MRYVIAAVVGLLVATGVAQAQDLTGQWQGTLQPPQGRELRIVLRIASAGSGLQGTFYSIDQGAQGIAATVAIQGTSVTIGIPGLNGSYDARLSDDGSSMTGTFRQGPGGIPLSLTRVSGDAAWALPSTPAALAPMPPTATPGIEVASIKPSNPGQTGKLFTIRGRTVVTVNTSAHDLLAFAYQLHARQVVGAPEWVTSDKFDVSVQPTVEGMPNEAQLRALIRQLLTDRFNLTFHRETRELPVYALVVAKDGPKLTASSGDPNGLPSLLFRGLGTLPVTNASMTAFTEVMQSAVLDRPVVDRTGLAGRFDFTLRWTPDESQFGGLGVRVPPPPDDPNAPPTLFTAIQEQLGLRFDATRGPVEVLAIDRIERPSEN